MEGRRSDKMLLGNKVFPGTVLGSTRPGFVEIVHANDLIGFRESNTMPSVDSVMAEAKRCQTGWGKANQVSFDPAKESAHSVSHAQPHDGLGCARCGQSGSLEADHHPEDQALPRSPAVGTSVQIEGALSLSR